MFVHLPPVISVIRPLDYEMVPKGMIYLTVMAKDGGNPALNSTVPVTVEVIVSITLQHTHNSNNLMTHSHNWRFKYQFLLQFLLTAVNKCRHRAVFCEYTAFDLVKSSACFPPAQPKYKHHKYAALFKL